MEKDCEPVPSLRERWSGRLGFMIGAIALVAWFAMLWMMFGDVL